MSQFLSLVQSRWLEMHSALPHERLVLFKGDRPVRVHSGQALDVPNPLTRNQEGWDRIATVAIGPHQSTVVNKHAIPLHTKDEIPVQVELLVQWRVNAAETNLLQFCGNPDRAVEEMNNEAVGALKGVINDIVHNELTDQLVAERLQDRLSVTSNRPIIVDRIVSLNVRARSVTIRDEKESVRERDVKKRQEDREVEDRADRMMKQVALDQQLHNNALLIKSAKADAERAARAEDIATLGAALSGPGGLRTFDLPRALEHEEAMSRIEATKGQEMLEMQEKLLQRYLDIITTLSGSAMTLDAYREAFRSVRHHVHEDTGASARRPTGG